MRKFYLKWGHVIATLALVVASNSLNIACNHVYYQPKAPDTAKRLRKF